MNETEEHIMGVIRNAVWSGFYSHEDVEEMLDDILEDDADEDMLRESVDPEFERKAEAEADWPDVTDCDLLDQAFEEARKNGFAALHNTGYAISDGLSDVAEWVKKQTTHFPYYCFYHSQDVEKAVGGDGLMLSFGAFSDVAADKIEAGKQLFAILKKVGLEPEWKGDPKKRIELNIDWQRRYVEGD